MKNVNNKIEWCLKAIVMSMVSCVVSIHVVTFLYGIILILPDQLLIKEVLTAYYPTTTEYIKQNMDIGMLVLFSIFTGVVMVVTTLGMMAPLMLMMIVLVGIVIFVCVFLGMIVDFFYHRFSSEEIDKFRKKEIRDENTKLKEVVYSPTYQ